MTRLETSKTTHFFRTDSRGFSLPEILIVLLLIAILAVLALPMTFRTLQIRKLDTSVAAVSDKALEARMYAIKRNREAWLRIDPVARTVQAQSRDNTGTVVNLTDPMPFPNGVNLLPSAAVEFHFDSLGRRAPGGQTVTFEAVSNGQTPKKTVSVTPAGKITASIMYE